MTWLCATGRISWVKSLQESAIRQSAVHLENARKCTSKAAPESQSYNWQVRAEAVQATAAQSGRLGYQAAGHSHPIPLSHFVRVQKRHETAAVTHSAWPTRGYCFIHQPGPTRMSLLSGVAVWPTSLQCRRTLLSTFACPPPHRDTPLCCQAASMETLWLASAFSPAAPSGSSCYKYCCAETRRNVSHFMSNSVRPARIHPCTLYGPSWRRNCRPLARPTPIADA